jgi:hypothetical protein
MELSANELTKWVKQYAKKQNWRITRMNNIPVQRRKGTVEKGWPDLIGYTDKGKFIAIEVKKIGDKLSIYQMERLDDVINCGGYAYICTEEDEQPLLVQWGETKFY